MHLSLAQKLVSLVVGAAFVAATLTVIVTYVVADQDLTQAQRQAVMNGTSLRAKTLADYERDIRGDAKFLQTMITENHLMERLETALEEVAKDGVDLNAIRNAYVDGSPHPVGGRHLLDKAEVGGTYSDEHAHIHPEMRDFLNARGYYDIFFISPSGDIIYSVYKEADFATNLTSGAYADSGLGEAFRAAMTLSPGGLTFSDFAPYAPSRGAPAAFVAEPIHGFDGKLQGVLALQVPSDRVESMLVSSTDEPGLFAFAANDQGVVVSEVGALDGDEALVATVDLAPARDGMKNWDGMGIQKSEAFIAAEATEFFGSPWWIVVEKNFAIATAPIANMRETIMLVFLPIMAAVFVASYFLARTVFPCDLSGSPALWHSPAQPPAQHALADQPPSMLSRHSDLDDSPRHPH